MGFTYDLGTDIGKVRLRICDTAGVAPGGSATSGYVFDDVEIQAFLDAAGTVGGAAIRALDAMIVSRSLRAKRFTVPGLSYDDTAAIADLQAARTQIATDEAVLPTIRVGTISANASGDPLLTIYPQG